MEQMQICYIFTENMLTAPFYKVNVDRAWTTSFHAGVGIIIRDSRGTVMGGEAKFLLRFTIEEIEAKAVLAGMLLACKHQLHKVIIESESESVINDITNNHCKGSWRIFPIITVIHCLANHFSNI
ncbi:hypothetical protein ACFX2I_008682 [Malus domestica]